MPLDRCPHCDGPVSNYRAVEQIIEEIPPVRPRVLKIITYPRTTVYRVDDSRGSQVVHEVLGENFAGMLISDCLSSYDPAPYRKHKCIAHHLRAIAQAQKLSGTAELGYLYQSQ